jgi:hypothetical protein
MVVVSGRFVISVFQMSKISSSFNLLVAFTSSKGVGVVVEREEEGEGEGEGEGEREGEGDGVGVGVGEGEGEGEREGEGDGEGEGEGEGVEYVGVVDVIVACVFDSNVRPLVISPSSSVFLLELTTMGNDEINSAVFAFEFQAGEGVVVVVVVVDVENVVVVDVIVPCVASFGKDWHSHKIHGTYRFLPPDIKVIQFLREHG